VIENAPAQRNKGRQKVGVLTVGGEVSLWRRYFWSGGSSGVYAIDAVIGIEETHASVGARDFCCSMGIVQDFEQGADDLARLTGLQVSAERLRQITEAEGEAVARVRQAGTLSRPPAIPQLGVSGRDRYPILMRVFFR
jgi:hypothetical protein